MNHLNIRESELGARRGHVDTWLAGALALIPVIGAMPAMGDWCRLTPDSFGYLETARSLAESTSFPQRRIMTPPGFSIFLAPLLRLGDTPFLGIRILLTICWGAAASLTYLLYRAEFGRFWAAAIAGLVATNSRLFLQTTTVLSEPPFLVLSMLTLLIFARWRNQCPSTAQIAAAGLLCAAATLTRSIGGVLAPIGLLAIASSAGPRLRWAGLFGASFAAPLIAWQVHQNALPGDYGYADIWLHSREVENTRASGVELQLNRFVTMTPVRMESIKAVLVPQVLGWRMFEGARATPISWLVGGGIVGLMIARAVRKRSLADIYGVGLLLLLCFWPWDEGERLVAPLVPVFAGALIWLIRSLRDRFDSMKGVRIGALASLVLLATVQAGEMSLILRRMPAMAEKARAQMASMREFGDWQEEILRSDQRVLCIAPKHDTRRELVAGAAYLSRRGGPRFVDVMEGQCPQAMDGAPVLVHESVVFQVEGLQGRIELGRRSPFILYSASGMATADVAQAD